MRYVLIGVPERTGEGENDMAGKNKNRKRWDAVTTVVYPLLFAVLLIAAWQTKLLHRLLHVDAFILPIPTRILTIIQENWGSIAENLQSTVIVIVIGLLAGSLFGYLIALIAAAFPHWGAGGLTIVSCFNAVPVVALAPVIINWTRDVSGDVAFRSMVAKCIVVMIFCTATMSINAFRGLTEVKPFSEDLMRSYAANRFTVFWKLRLPNSIPYIFTALHVSVPLAVITAVVSEYFAEYIIGVGRMIRENIVTAQYATAWAYIIVACVLGIGMYLISILLERLFLRKHK